MSTIPRAITQLARRPRRRTVLVLAATATMAVVAGACDASGTAIHTPYGNSKPPKLQSGPTYEVKVGTVSGLGKVLVDGQGITLYMFAADHRGSPSTCVSVCAIQWPPLTLPSNVAAPVAGPGVKGSLLGTAPRSDGTEQITYDGWPLYTWPQDAGPGEATGQALTNLGGRWYVLDPDGHIVTRP